MNTYRNRMGHGRNPMRGVKPARTVTPEQSEATRMATQIRDLCGCKAFETFVTMRQEGATMDALRVHHAVVTAAAIERADALAADWREDQADRLDYAKGRY